MTTKMTSPLALAGLMLSACGPAATGPSMQVSTSGAPIAGRPSELTIRLKDAEGRAIDKLEVVHEKKLHLLILSKDLAFFAHEHPRPTGDGALALDFSFPRAGEYLLFGDFKPAGGQGSVTSTRLTVQGDGRMSEATLKKEDLSQPKRSGAYEVLLDIAAHGSDTMLTFTISKGGRPVADLRPYLGALGHLVVVDAGASRLLHSHPMGAGDPGKVGFHTAFPAPGLYKLWAEFRPEGEPLRVDFIVEAPSSSHGRHAH